MCFRFLFSKAPTLRQTGRKKIEVNKNLAFLTVFSPTETSQTNLPTVPSSKEGVVGSNSPTTVGSDHVGWGDFSCSSSEVGDQVLLDAQEVVMGAPIPCIGIWIFTYMNGWFLMVKYGNVGIPYMDAMGLDGSVGWFCQEQHDSLHRGW